MTIIKKLITSNFTPNRDGQVKPTQFTFHTAVSGADSLFSYFNNPNTRSSTHGYVKFDGVVEQYVEFNHTAWANANWQSNIRSITFETQDNGNPNDTVRTDALYESCAQLAAQANRDYGTPLILLTKEQALANLPGFTKHSYYSARSCPAGLDIPRILTRALIINQTPMPSFDYNLYMKAGQLYMHVLIGSINEVITIKNLTKNTSFTATANKNPTNDGKPINESPEAALYEVIAKGVVHQHDNRPVTPPTPIDPCEIVKTELEAAKKIISDQAVTIGQLNGKIVDLNNQLSAFVSETIYHKK